VIDHPHQTSLLHSPFFRPVWLPTVVSTVLLMLSLTLLVGMSWRNLQRLHPVHRHLEQLSSLQQTGLRLEELLVNQLAENPVADTANMQLVRGEIGHILAVDTHLVPATAHNLQTARDALADVNLNRDPRRALIASLTTIRRVIAAEAQAHDVLMNGVRRDTLFEFRIAAAALVALPLLAVAGIFLMRQRIFQPLNELGSLMALLARQDYNPAPMATVEPALKPLFDNYNHLVSRLAELEQQNRAHRRSLENQVHSATQALLEQQRALGNAERLAAVGEVAAGLAHELRNPLAGIQMALNNLRQEIEDRDHTERLSLVINELNRTVSLLNALLGQTRQEAEAVVAVELAPAIDELLTLARYQIGEHIMLQHEIPPGLVCRLPAGRLHQSVLNLILNAAQAIGNQPGTIGVRAELRDNEIRLAVHDDGPGLPAALMQNGIRPFVSGRLGGTGLGLAMVQRFALDVGGRIELSNRKPRGACVTLILPCGGKRG
jgi:two-component system NtrC family sensor kinase